MTGLSALRLLLVRLGVLLGLGVGLVLMPHSAAAHDGPAHAAPAHAAPAMDAPEGAGLTALPTDAADAPEGADLTGLALSCLAVLAALVVAAVLSGRRLPWLARPDAPRGRPVHTRPQGRGPPRDLLAQLCVLRT